MSELIERSRKLLERADELEHFGLQSKSTFRELANAVQENVTALEASSQRIKELEAGLRAAEMAMTCRRDDDAHYCPNCDNSLYAARADIRALLQQKETSND